MLHVEKLAFYAVVNQDYHRSLLVVESPSLMSSVIELYYEVRGMQVNYPYLLFFDGKQAHLCRLVLYNRLTEISTCPCQNLYTYYIDGDYLTAAPPGCRQISYFDEHQHAFLLADRAVVGAATYLGNFDYVVQHYVVRVLPNKLQVFGEGNSVFDKELQCGAIVMACGNGVAIVYDNCVQICQFPGFSVCEYTGVGRGISAVCFSTHKVVCKANGVITDLIPVSEEFCAVEATDEGKLMRIAQKVHAAAQGEHLDAEKREKYARYLAQ